MSVDEVIEKDGKYFVGATVYRENKKTKTKFNIVLHCSFEVGDVKKGDLIYLDCGLKYRPEKMVKKK